MTEEVSKTSAEERLYVLPEKENEESIDFKRVLLQEIPRDIKNVFDVMKESYLSGDTSHVLDTFFRYQQNNITTYVGACSTQVGAAIFVDVVDSQYAGRSFLEPDRGYFVPRWTSTEKAFQKKGLGTRRIVTMNAYCRQFLKASLTSSCEIGSFAPEVWKALERAGYVKQIEQRDDDGNTRFQFI